MKDKGSRAKMSKNLRKTNVFEGFKGPRGSSICAQVGSGLGGIGPRWNLFGRYHGVLQNGTCSSSRSAAGLKTPTG